MLRRQELGCAAGRGGGGFENGGEYDREIYKRRNEVERLFRRLKGFRRIFTRYDKLDALFLGFIVFVLIFDALVSVNTP